MTEYNMGNIGLNAGKVWNVLAANGGKLESISQQASLPVEHVYLALGWLARENKINFVPRSHYTFVELTKSEKDTRVKRKR
jgi:hypothetical protein